MKSPNAPVYSKIASIGFLTAVLLLFNGCITMRMGGLESERHFARTWTAQEELSQLKIYTDVKRSDIAGAASAMALRGSLGRCLSSSQGHSHESCVLTSTTSGENIKGRIHSQVAVHKKAIKRKGQPLTRKDQVKSSKGNWYRGLAEAYQAFDQLYKSCIDQFQKCGIDKFEISSKRLPTKQCVSFPDKNKSLPATVFYWQKNDRGLSSSQSQKACFNQYQVRYTIKVLGLN